MNKRKKITILLAVILGAALLGLGICWGVEAYRNHQIQYTVKDTLPDGQGKKATIILLGGQSNASGCSLDEYLKKNVTPEKYAEYDQGYDNVFINYYVSGNHESQAFVKCATRQGEMGAGFGPELGLAEKLHQMYPDETFFIIKWAWGGSNLYAQWLSPSSQGKTGSLYRHFVKYVETSIRYLESKNYDVEIAGMCWMQGESDAFSPENAADYAVHLKNFIQDIRKEFSRYSAKDGFAFIDAYIAANPAYWVYYEQVNRSKKAVADASTLNVVIDTNAHGLVCNKEPAENPDIPHYDSMSQIKLGHLFAEALSAFLPKGKI
jgi:hypothetical protein